MFNDIGVLELVTLVVLAMLIFGPDKLPKVIQDASRFIRKVREFSESAKQDIRTELGPEFKDFEFEDLNPKTFVRKQLMEGEDALGLREIRESFDLRKDLSEVTDAVHGREASRATDTTDAVSAANGSSGGADLLKKGASDPLAKTAPDPLRKTASDPLTKREGPAAADRPPFDADAT
ncbi:sec-independent translocase [Streptomyces sp. DT24]|uniref:sec-independent translocase n=1 Tax=unclassified Streptomyces TaxID=2593676 RepID=UPI0023B94B8A|nr:sec-independent translocase [Streptomyces sp. AM 4-1-1]WEH35703.1 sec-independent translocase [Streptomyces sp. AM 4-1-1]